MVQEGLKKKIPPKFREYKHCLHCLSLEQMNVNAAMANIKSYSKYEDIQNMKLCKV